MNIRRVTAPAVILITLLFFSAIIGACRRDAALPSFDAGRNLYSSKCASCHSADGSGGKLVGAVVASDLRAQKLGEAYGSNIALMRRAILDGKNVSGADLNLAMPRFRGKLSEADATNIIVFMESLRVPPSNEPVPNEGGDIVPPGVTPNRGR